MGYSLSAKPILNYFNLNYQILNRSEARITRNLKFKNYVLPYIPQRRWGGTVSGLCQGSGSRLL